MLNTVHTPLVEIVKAYYGSALEFIVDKNPCLVRDSVRPIGIWVYSEDCTCEMLIEYTIFMLDQKYRYTQEFMFGKKGKGGKGLRVPIRIPLSLLTD